MKRDPESQFSIPQRFQDKSIFRGWLHDEWQRKLRHLSLWPLSVLILLLIVLIGTVNYLYYLQGKVDHTNEVLTEIRRVEKLVVDLETGLRGHRMTGEAVFLEPYERAEAALPGEIDTLGSLLQDSPTQKEELYKLREVLSAWKDFAKSVQTSVSTKLPIDMSRQLHGKTLMDALRLGLHKLEINERNLGDNDFKNLARVKIFLIPGLLLGGLVFSSLLVSSVRRTFRQLDGDYRAAWEDFSARSARLNAALASVGDAVIITDSQGVVAYLNSVAETLTGWSDDDARGQPINSLFSIFNEDTQNAVESPGMEALRLGAAVTLVNHSVLRAKDGRAIPISDSAAPIRDASGQITGMVMVLRDETTERKNLKELMERTRLLNLTSDATLIRDLDGIITYWNDGAEKMYGWSSSEAIGKRCHDLLQTESSVPIEELSEELFRNNHWTGEFVHTKRDGQRITVLVRKAVDRDRQGKATAISQTVTDITDRKREEEAALRLAAIIESSSDAILSKDLNGTITSWNSSAQRLFGYSIPEIVGQPVTMLMPPERYDEETEILERLGRGERIERYETVRLRKDGTLFDVSLTVSPVINGEGVVIGISKIVRDITERKQTERELREAEDRFRVLANSMPQLAWSARPDGHIFWYNQRWYDYTGTTPEEMEGWGWQSVHDQAELPKVLEQWKMTLATMEPFERIIQLRGVDGIFRPFLTRVVPLKNEIGQVMRWFGTNTDVDELQRAQEALRSADQRFRFMAESMPQKIFTATPDGAIDFYNFQWSDFTGLTAQQMKETSWLKFVHPDDVEETIRCRKHAMKTGEHFELAHRFRRKDGVYRWHLSRADAMRDTQGNITMWIGSNTDIDDMMRAHEELVDAQAQLASRADLLERLVVRRTARLRAAHEQLLVETEERTRLESVIATAIEAERERLGLELHDGLVQELTGIGMLLHALEQQLKQANLELSANVGRVCRMIEDAHGSARDLARNFYPVELEKHGLRVALEGIAQRTQKRYGILCQVLGDAAVLTLDEAIAIQLFRIAQEAVQNAIKHSQAGEISIYLNQEENTLRLTITDNGVGLPDAQHKPSGMGLSIMRYRAGMIQGTLSVNNSGEGGAVVSCELSCR